ncbi:sensor histidine kinase [Xanthomonas campestris]|uniref:sensor histidine kinase n=1 Tax=Xanthomonas campestris TaxID=339 RepID=UPI00164A50FF|nr:histidine kinase [Xanthomonas campestris]
MSAAPLIKSNNPSTSLDWMKGNRSVLRVRWHWVGLSWLMLALAYTPAVVLTPNSAGTREASSFLHTFLFLVGSYTPWALTTPMLLGLSGRWIIGTGRSAYHLIWIALFGLLAIPLLTGMGWGLGHGVLNVFGLAGQGQLDMRSSQRALAATALFAIPLYLAVMGVGQLLAHTALKSERERLLMRLNEEALRSRLHQHFIFNALNAIVELGYRDAPKADRALGHVANLLRALLESAPAVALREEIGACAEFIELHQVLSGNITFVVEIEGCAWGASVPSMVLQPLLENAIQHGADIDGSVEIKIGANTQGGDLVVSVVNSVNGRSASGLGIGLDHLRKRLVLAHGAEASLTTRREENRFIASIRLPLMEHDQP